ncbi:exosporium leader peptide-containing protein [Bacillus hominis]
MDEFLSSAALNPGSIGPTHSRLFFVIHFINRGNRANGIDSGSCPPYIY